MHPEILEQISVLVRSGFYTKADLTNLFCEEIYPPGELDAHEVSAALDSEINRLTAEMASWPETTDCDRLDEIFESLMQRGIISLHNAGYTQSDGYEDFLEACVDYDEDRVIGYCYYHGQDVEAAVRGQGLYLAFGPPDPEDEQSKGPEIGKAICEELRNAGFEVSWDGTFNQRILIPNFDWKRRFPDDGDN